jgi:hypothetical protein
MRWLVITATWLGFTVMCIACRARPETSGFDAAKIETGPSAPPADDALAAPSPTDSAAQLAPDLAYDRQADLQAWAAEARRQLGAQTVIRVEGDVFVLAAPRASPKFDQAAVLARQALEAFYGGGRFTKRPDRAVSAFIFDAQGPFDAHCRALVGANPEPLLGAYSLKTRTICVNAGPGASTLVHEMVHPIIQTDFPHAPAWIDEAIASLYESPIFPKQGEIEGVTNWRLARLQHALDSAADKDKLRVDALFVMSDADFRGRDIDLHYAVARFFAQWLDARRALWPFYCGWRDGYTDDKSGEKAFRAAVGTMPAEVNGEWIAWVRQLSGRSR